MAGAGRGRENEGVDFKQGKMTGAQERQEQMASVTGTVKSIWRNLSRTNLASKDKLG